MQAVPPTIAIVGFGNLTQALLPLLRHMFSEHRLVAFDRDVGAVQAALARRYRVRLHEVAIDRHNHAEWLAPHLGADSFLLNLAGGCSSIDLIALAQQHHAMYLDTAIDGWRDEASGAAAADGESGFALRQRLLHFAEGRAGRSTALVAHGANPGMVSVLAKLAIERMAVRHLPQLPGRLREQADFARTAEQLGLRVVQVSRHDRQQGRLPRRPGEFRDTGSPDRLIRAALQRAELGWGSHETALPVGAAGAAGANSALPAAIRLAEPSLAVAVRSWAPIGGDFDAMLVNRNASLSLADYLTRRGSAAAPCYRPTVFSAYRPCPDAIDSLALLGGGAVRSIHRRRVLKADIGDGVNMLGVFMISDRYPAMWVGSQLSIARTRLLAPHNNASSLQSVSSMVAAMRWMLVHRRRGVIESEALDARAIFAEAAPYWGPMVFQPVEWRPRAGSESLQFADFRLPEWRALGRPAAAASATRYPADWRALARVA